MKKNDVILIGVILVLALVSFGGIYLYSAPNTGNGEAVVYLDGAEQGRYRLDQELSLEIPAGQGNYNVLEIKDGKADITEASCPDKICVNHRPVKNPGERLVCLPNRVVVEIEKDKEPGLDAAVR